MRSGRRPDPVPDVYFAGSSPAALDVAARHADVYLTWGEPPAQVAEKLDRVRELAAAQGRTPRFGIRLHVVSRDTAEEAWTVANALLDGISEEEIAKVHARMQTTESEGQRRMLELHGGSRDNLEVSPNLWAGVGLARGGAGTALVGSHAEVADRIEEYAALGHRRVHPLGLPAPRGALLVRRRASCPCWSSGGRGPAPPAWPRACAPARSTPAASPSAWCRTGSSLQQARPTVHHPSPALCYLPCVAAGP